jgi:hypothetical protein
MNKHWLFLAAALALGTALPTSAMAASVRVTTAAKLRAEPWIGGVVIEDLAQDQLLELLANDGDWLHVQVPETGHAGYVQRRFVYQVRPTVARPSAAAARARSEAGPWERRLTVSAGAMFLPQQVSITEARDYPDPLQTPPVEAVALTAEHKYDPGLGLDLGVEARLFGPLGIALAYSSAARTGNATYQASLPHPLYLKRPRRVEGEDTGYARNESVVHVSLAASPLRGRATVTLSAGLSLFKVEADMIQTIEYQQRYPYEDADVTLTPPKKQRLKDSPTGFHAGATLDYGLIRHLAVGAGVRYSQAKARLNTSSGSVIETDVGGLELRGTLRLFF